MASMFLRLVKGNAANPPPIDDDIGIMSFTGSLQEWQSGAMARADLISEFSLTVEDETDLDLFKQWYNAATNQDLFIRVFRDRLYCAEDKSNGVDGRHGYAVKNTFLNGKNGTKPFNGSF